MAKDWNRLTKIQDRYQSLVIEFETNKKLGRLGTSRDQNKWLNGKVLLDAEETSALFTTGTAVFIETKLTWIQQQLHVVGQRLLKPILIVSKSGELVVELKMPRS